MYEFRELLAIALCVAMCLAAAAAAVPSMSGVLVQMPVLEDDSLDYKQSVVRRDIDISDECVAFGRSRDFDRYASLIDDAYMHITWRESVCKHVNGESDMMHKKMCHSAKVSVRVEDLRFALYHYVVPYNWMFGSAFVSAFVDQIMFTTFLVAVTVSLIHVYRKSVQ